MINKSDLPEDNNVKFENIETLMEYQKDSVVSKTLIGKKAGTVTLFAFDKGQGLSEHTAPFDAMVYIVTGEAKVTLAGSEMNMKKGDMVILPADKPHALFASEQFKMLLVMIKSSE